MTHDDAMKMMAAERYILGELEPSERDAFEEHFFDCTICADDVRDSTKFADGVRTSDARVKVARFNWWAAAASVFVVSVVARSPDRATRPDRRSPLTSGDLRSAAVARSGDRATTERRRVASRLHIPDG